MWKASLTCHFTSRVPGPSHSMVSGTRSTEMCTSKRRGFVYAIVDTVTLWASTLSGVCNDSIGLEWNIAGQNTRVRC